jgi:tRNA (guanine-N7-)-methyltransferase
VRRIRNHVNPLKMEYAGRREARLALPPAGEVEAELGCADARFLFERAAAHPEVTCVGVEIREDLVTDVNARAAAAGLGNLRAVFAHINVDLDRLFPDGRLARVFINFPDPWFKRRHHKRRVLTDEVARALHRKLARGGELLFQSDVFEVALEAMATIEGSELFDCRGGAWSFAADHGFGARSLREVRCAEKGMRIWRMLYQRRETTP